MTRVSDWYSSFGHYSFPTVFIRMRSDEVAALLNDDSRSSAGGALIGKIQRAIRSLPGPCYIHADTCAPTDSALYQKRNGSVNSGEVGWNMLVESAKVRMAFETGASDRVCLRPYRRMDHSREFRLFVKGRKLAAICQRYLDRHHTHLEQRRDVIERKTTELAVDVGPLLLADDLTIDVYLTSDGELMIVDMNSWGRPTEPLLLRDWDRDWDHAIGLQLVPKPVTIQGKVSVSF